MHNSSCVASTALNFEKPCFRTEFAASLKRLARRDQSGNRSSASNLAVKVSNTSSERFAGFSEGKGAVPVYLCLKALFTDRFLDDIDLAAQHQR